MLLMTLLLFVAFPRVGLGFIGRSSQRGQHVAGFGNDVELGGFGVIRDDPTVVVRVSAGRAARARSSRTKALRLRGTAFDHYDGRTLDAQQGRAGAYVAHPRLLPAAADANAERPDTQGGAGAARRAGAVPADRHRRPAHPAARRTGRWRAIMSRLMRSHGLDVRYRSGDELGLVYDAVVSSNPLEIDLPVARDTDDARYLQMPSGHERVAALAKSLAGDLD